MAAFGALLAERFWRNAFGGALGAAVSRSLDAPTNPQPPVAAGASSFALGTSFTVLPMISIAGAAT